MNRLYKLSHFIVLFFIACVSQAQHVENALLWKIEGNGIKDSYLLGTMHILCDASLSTRTQQAIENSQQIVLEIDMDDDGMMSTMMEYLELPDNDRISNYLTVADQDTLNAFLKKNADIGLTYVDTMHPFMIQSMLYPKMMVCPVQSMEENIMQLAHAQNKEVLGLETVAAQMEALFSLPIENQVKSLVDIAVDGIDEQVTLFAQMQEAYMNADLNQLEAMLNADEGLVGNNTEVLLVNRNKNWLPQIIKMSKRKRSFYAVGAGHLAGPYGLINLLRNAGFKLTPVTTP